MKRQTIYLLQITYNYGEIFSAYSDQEMALAGLAAYVRENWLDEMGSEPMPSDEGEAISDYFHACEDYESYGIHELELDGEALGEVNHA